MAGKRVMEALQLRKKGYNCAQAVAVPFCEELGMDKAAAFRALEGFGAGMGCYGLTCGALSGAVFVAGLKYSDGELEKPTSKRATYVVCADIVDEFTKEFNSNSCHEIRGIETGKPLASCDRCVMVAASLAERIISNNSDEK